MQGRTQVVSGSAPTKRKRLRIGWVSLSPTPRQRPGHRLEVRVRVAAEGGHLGFGQEADVGRRLDPLDEVARHALVEVRSADEQVHPGGVGGEVDRGLAGGVAAADQRHLGARAEPRLDRRGPVPDAAALEALDVAERRPAVAGAAGDDHGAGGHAAAVVELEAVGALGAEADELGDLRREDDLGAELLGLHEGAAGQRLAGDAGREAEIVLDPGAGPGLAAVALGVENGDRQALGGGVDGGGEPGGAGAHHRDVEHLAARRPPGHAEGAAELADGRVEQRLAGGNDDHGQHRAARPAVAEEACRRGVDRGVGDLVGKRAPPEKGREADHVGVVGVADDQRAAVARLDELHPPQDQRAGDPLAQGRLRDEKRAEAGRRDQDGRDVAFGVAVDQRRAAGQGAGLGEELARALLHHRLAPAEAVALGDRHHAVEHDEHAGRRLAGDEERLARPVVPLGAEAAQPVDFLGGQERKGLVVARVERDAVGGLGPGVGRGVVHGCRPLEAVRCER